MTESITIKHTQNVIKLAIHFSEQKIKETSVWNIKISAFAYNL